MNPQINKYYNEIDQQIKLGAANEQNLRPHFHALLRHYTDSEGLVLQYEQKEKNTLFSNYPDGRIMREGIPVGHLEDKDPKDDIYKEIDNKLNTRGYPNNNILFENAVRVVLYQDGKKVEDIDIREGEELNRVLLRYVQYQTEEQKAFIEALNTVKGLVPVLATKLRAILNEQKDVNKVFRESLDEFLAENHKAINKYLDYNDVIEIIIQHILTEDIFIIFFSDANFHRQNTIAQSIDKVMQSINDKKREIQSEIDGYIQVLKKFIFGMGKEDKKDVLKIFYEDFYTALNDKKADVQGVVYTPLAIVRFMIESTEHLLYKHFNTSMSQKGVRILDPCTGTGIFMSEMIEYLNKDNLAYKYENELFVNEIDVLPYYIANLNIEYSYHERMGQYKNFENICLIDTLEFQKDGSGGQLFGASSSGAENVERAKRQYEQEISVVIGNPPYNANQKSENDNNKNKIYADVDKRIKETYIKESTAQKTKQHDMYKRFIRWASDRINDNGMISFITNNAYLDAKQDDGFRKCVQNEFDHVYIYDLGGNVRKNPKLSGPKNNVFAIQTGVAIIFLVKDKDIQDKKARFHYKRLPELATRQEKLFELVTYTNHFNKIPFEQIIPTDKGQWLNQTDNDFHEHPALISKEVKNKGIGDQKAIFKMFSLGVATNRDNWAYDMNPKQLENKVQKLISVYDVERAKYKGVDYQNFEMKRDLDYSVKWSRDLLKDMQYDKSYECDPSAIRPSLYRPFCKSYLAFQDGMIDVIGVNRRFFPTGAEGENLCINFNSFNSAQWSTIATQRGMDLNAFYGGSVHTPLYVYNDKGEREENITEWGLELFREKYGESMDARSVAGAGRTGATEITPRAVMEYCYAVLSSPSYQEKYADNLKTDYPTIPMYDDFEFYRSRGEQLIELHANYEEVTPYQGLIVAEDQGYMPEGIENPNFNHVTHPMKIDKKKGVLILDNKNTIANIPLEAFEYKIGSRSALDWVVEYHKFKKLNPEKELHHKTLIEEGLDTYDWRNIRSDLLNLVPKIITVSVETQRILGELRDE